MRAFSIVLLYILLLFHHQASANDSLYIQRLVKRIYSQQARNDTYFPEGLYPSYREYYFNRGTFKNDDNSFFTGLIVFTLRQLRPFLDTNSQVVCDSIFNKAAPVFKRFQNRQGRNIYNFWRTNPVTFLPNSGLLSLYKGGALPDDADCSVIALMALARPVSIADEVHQYMQAFTNNYKHIVKSTFASYKKLPAYSTWLGHKMPIDFDICVLSNILYFVHAYHLPYTKADSASLQLISKAVQLKQYKTDAVYISPYYNKTSVILYHLARLMSARHIPELELFRCQLIDDAKTSYKRTSDLREKVILANALLKWHVVLPEFEQELTESSLCTSNDFVFFVANLACTLANPFNRFLTSTNMGRFDYYCPAYDDVLMLEHLVLKKQVKGN